MRRGPMLSLGGARAGGTGGRGHFGVCKLRARRPLCALRAGVHARMHARMCTRAHAHRHSSHAHVRAHTNTHGHTRTHTRTHTCTITCAGGTIGSVWCDDGAFRPVRPHRKQPATWNDDANVQQPALGSYRGMPRTRKYAAGSMHWTAGRIGGELNQRSVFRKGKDATGDVSARIRAA